MLISYRRLRRTYLRPLVLVLGFLFLIDAVRLVRGRPPVRRTKPTLDRRTPASPAGNTTVFIVSVHRNTEEILRTVWNDAVLALIDHLGPENIHFSAVESGSQEDTKGALLDLKAELDRRHVSNTISLGMTVWEQLEEIDRRPPRDGPREPGWIWNKAESQYELRRIPYLSRVRNQAMAPLKELEKTEGRYFDKVLWLNDVVFDTEDIVTLLNTRDGDYAAACGMDYKEPPLYYDTFALRDDLGLKTASLHWPWFQSPTARDSALRGEPVRVASCWNGVVVFDAAPFYSTGATTTPPLLFRGIDDSLADFHLEGSECCLIHADNPLTAQKGVWLNPGVRVGYDAAAYRAVRATATHSDETMAVSAVTAAPGRRYPGTFWTIVGAWSNRLSRWHAGVQSSIEARTVRGRIDQWRAETPAAAELRHEPGEACLINEMQIMWSNGWMHL